MIYKFSIKRIVYFALILVLFGKYTLCYSSTSVISISPEDFFEKIVSERKGLTYFVTVIPDSSEPYSLNVNSSYVLPLIRKDYSIEQIENIFDVTNEARKLELMYKPWGTFIKAVSVNDRDIASKTHYDAIWIRDSLWGALALENSGDLLHSKQIIMTLWDYISTDAQLMRMKNVISDPDVLNAQDGQMKAIHVRFNAASENFEDIMENGLPQQWNHKQNDALGFLLDLILRKISTGEFTGTEWNKGSRMNALISLIAYFDRVNYAEMPDSGMWEENEKVNTSSVAMITSSLEKFREIMKDNKNNSFLFKKDITSLAEKMGYSEFIQKLNIDKLIENGYSTIKRQLSCGGESPIYPQNDKRHRTADAALLSLIYPANLMQLSLTEKKNILKEVSSLSGSYGIKRYVGDSYQSANFWFNHINTDTGSGSFFKREKSFIKYTEPQWFFDSWFALSSLQIYKETGDLFFYKNAVKYMNRSLSQLTDSNMYAANTDKLESMQLPESYNFIYNGNMIIAIPSPITPLNWAKASLTILLKEMGSVSRKHNGDE